MRAARRGAQCAALGCAVLLWAGAGQAEDPAACVDRPGGEVFAFTAPPPPPPASRKALQRGRELLRRGEGAAVVCGTRASGMQSGYVVATLRGAAMRFAAPEPIPAPTLRCLEEVGGRLRGAAPAAGADGLPTEQSAVWILRPPSPPVAAPPAGGQSVAPPRREFAEIQAEVRRHLPALASCLEELWEERPHAAGTLMLRLTIAEHGGIDDATVLRHEPSLRAAEECLLRVAGRWRFPARWGGGRTVMSYPLILSPPGPPPAAPEAGRVPASR